MQTPDRQRDRREHRHTVPPTEHHVVEHRTSHTTSRRTAARPRGHRRRAAAAAPHRPRAHDAAPVKARIGLIYRRRASWTDGVRAGRGTQPPRADHPPTQRPGRQPPTSPMTPFGVVAGARTIYTLQHGRINRRHSPPDQVTAAPPPAPTQVGAPTSKHLLRLAPQFPLRPESPGTFPRRQPCSRPSRHGSHTAPCTDASPTRRRQHPPGDAAAQRGPGLDPRRRSRPASGTTTSTASTRRRRHRAGVRACAAPRPRRPRSRAAPAAPAAGRRAPARPPSRPNPCA